MGVYRKPLDLYKAQKARFDRVQKSARAMHQDVALAGYDDAMELTGGRLTPKQTKGAFARRPSGLRRAAAVPKLPINIQSSRLRRNFRLVLQSQRPQEFRLYNPTSYAPYVLKRPGTRKMVYRGFQDQITQRWKARNKALIDHLRARQRSA